MIPWDFNLHASLADSSQALSKSSTLPRESLKYVPLRRPMVAQHTREFLWRFV